MEQIIRCGGGEPVLRQNRIGDLEYLTFPLLEQTGMVRHLFSTRLGGVSRGIYRSMNFSISRGDDVTCVSENYRRIAKALHCTPDQMVATQQTHTTNIRVVTEEDCGKGIVREQDYKEIDGLVTEIPGICLVAVFADCVPLYFVDPVRRVIGLAHSGWRGTAARMGACMVDKMREAYGSKPEDLIAAVGPSVCRDCYEVGEDVAEVFQKSFPNEAVAVPGRRPDKFQLDLWLANRLILQQAGIRPERISVTDICTCHNPDYLFSHRASNGRRGNLGAFLMIS